MDADIKDLVTDESFIGNSSEVTVDIRRPVGAGGIGTVYFGTFRHKAAAVKVIDRKKHSAMDLKALIGGDIRAARDLHSPMHVATVCAFVAVPSDESIAKKLGHPPTPEVWLVMEHVEGKSLTQVMSEVVSIPALDPLERTSVTLRVMYSVSKDLAYIHSRDYAHLDLSSNNIMCAYRRTGGAGGVVTRLIDFGSARYTGAVGGADVLVGTCSVLALTQGYASPEMVEAAEAKNAASAAGVVCDVKLTLAADVYSFGMILLQMLTGKTTAALAKMNTAVTLKHLRAVAGVPAELHSLIVSCVEYEPEDRPTAAAVCGALGRALGIDDSSSSSSDGVVSVPGWAARFLGAEVLRLSLLCVCC